MRKKIFKNFIAIAIIVVMFVFSAGISNYSPVTVAADSAVKTAASTAADAAETGLSSSLTDALSSVGGQVAPEAAKWAASQLMNMIGMPDYETRVENKLGEISDKIDELAKTLASIKKELNQIKDLQNYAIVSNRILAFETAFTNMNTSVNKLYTTLNVLSKVNSNSESYDAEKYLENIEYFIKLAEGKDSTVKIDDITGVGQFITDTLNYGSMILPSVSYDTSIFGTAKEYFEYNKVWAHEAYSQRETFRSAVLGVYEKSVEIVRTVLLYRLDKTFGIGNLGFSSDGQLMTYIDIDNLTDENNVYNKKYSGRELYNKLIDDSLNSNLIDNMIYNLNFSSESESNKAVSKADNKTKESYSSFLSNSEILDYIIKYEPITNIFTQKIKAAVLVDTLTSLNKQIYKVVTYAKKDIDEETQNSNYRIHLKLISGKVVVMNKINKPFSPNDVVKSDLYEKITTAIRDDFTLICNGTTFSLNGYDEPAVINTVFTPTSINIFNDFVSYIPDSYKVLGGKKTLYDYLSDNGFVFYDADGNKVTDAKIALGCNRYNYKNKNIGYKLSFVYINLSQNLSERMSYKMTSAGRISNIVNQFNFLSSKYRYVLGFTTPMYNIGFPSAYSKSQLYERYCVANIIKAEKGVTFGIKINDNIYSDSQDSNTTDKGENSIAKR